MSHCLLRRVWPHADQAHLPDFFIKGHFAEQLVNKGVTRLFSHRMGAKQVICEGRLHGKGNSEANRANPFHQVGFS